jgi:hypothetical protein
MHQIRCDSAPWEQLLQLPGMFFGQGASSGYPDFVEFSAQ